MMSEEPARVVIEHRPVWEQAYGLLRAQILDGRLSPGAKLNLRDLAAQLDISVTPVRDAALRLASEGLVENAEGRGLTVTQFSEADIMHTMDLRTLLEAYAVERAGPFLSQQGTARLEELLNQEEALIRDDGAIDIHRYATVSQRFHRELVVVANDRVLLDLYERLHAYVVMERAQNGFVNDRIVDDHQEHIDIVAALRAGAYSDAARLLREHLVQVKRETLLRYRRQEKVPTAR
jgi:DNA-binding GntR family transcriptional regulator